jgi:hypothetical protein
MAHSILFYLAKNLIKIIRNAVAFDKGGAGYQKLFCKRTKNNAKAKKRVYFVIETAKEKKSKINEKQAINKSVYEPDFLLIIQLTWLPIKYILNND